MTIKDLSDVRGEVEILQWVKAQQKELKDLEERTRAKVEDAMGSHDVGVLDGEVVINWGRHKRKAFDQKAFAEAHPDLYELFKTSSSVRRFEVVNRSTDDE